MEECVMDNKNKKRLYKIRAMQFLIIFIAVFLIFQLKGFVSVIFTDEDAYEIRYETPVGMTNGQKIYMLYLNGEFYDDVDVNEYMLLDANGKTDLKYCALMHQAQNITYSLILGAMMTVVILIANSAIDGSPFTHENANRIRILGALQFALAILPGLVRFLMCFFRFEYVNTTTNFNGLYMFAIACAIMTLAQVFDYGVRLQEDVDSIA